MGTTSKGRAAHPVRKARGRRGGLATLAKHGRAHYQALGHRSAERVRELRAAGEYRPKVRQAETVKGSFHIRPDQLAWLKTRAVVHHCSVAELVREAIDGYRAEYEREAAKRRAVAKAKRELARKLILGEGQAEASGSAGSTGSDPDA